MKNLNSIVLGLGLLLAAFGCTNSGPTGPTGGTGAVSDADGGDTTATEPSTSTSTVSNLAVVNQSSVSVWYLYVSPSSSSSWGVDQLGSNVVSPGETFYLRNIPCGRNYDIKLEGAGHTTLATRYGVYFACGETMTLRLTGG